MVADPAAVAVGDEEGGGAGVSHQRGGRMEVARGYLVREEEEGRRQRHHWEVGRKELLMVGITGA